MKRLICLGLVLVSLLTPATSFLPGADLWGMGVTAEAAATVVNGVTIQGTPPTRVVKYRWPYMSGNDVKWIQSTLKAYGYSISVDGKYGPGSRDTCKKFQRAMGIGVDGQWGPTTTSKMQAWLKTKTQVKNELRVSGLNAPTGTLIKGQSFSIRGTITSSREVITKVTVGIYNTNGTQAKGVSPVTRTPNSKSYNIKQVDNYIRFGNLAEGSYVFRIYVTARNNATQTVVSSSFKVQAPKQTETQRLASQIINLDRQGKIYLYRQHASGRKGDGATAYDNIRDLANGATVVKRSNYSDGKLPKAPGGTTTLNVNILNILLDLQKKYSNKQIIVTAIAGSCHSRNSKHYAGKAIDFQIKGTSAVCTRSQGKEIFQYLTNKGYKLDYLYGGSAYEDSSHYHIQLK